MAAQVSRASGEAEAGAPHHAVSGPGSAPRDREGGSGASAVDASEFLTRPGTRAAGGLALAPALLWGAELVPGAELVADATELDAALAGADVVFAGEGRFDDQSFDGKVLSRVLVGAPNSTVFVVLAGSVALTLEECRAAGVDTAFSIADGPAAIAEMLREAPRLLTETAARVSALLAPGGGGPSSSTAASLSAAV